MNEKNNIKNALTLIECEKNGKKKLRNTKKKKLNTSFTEGKNFDFIYFFSHPFSIKFNYFAPIP